MAANRNDPIYRVLRSWIEEVSRMRNKLIGKVAAAVTVAVLSASTAFAGTFERVPAYRTDVWRAYVFAGVEVAIVVDGDNDTDLDVEKRVCGNPGHQRRRRLERIRNLSVRGVLSKSRERGAAARRPLVGWLGELVNW
jgi:hypothetical protein